MKAAHGNTLWHAPLHHVLRNNKRRRICVKKVAFTFIFNSKSLLHYSDIIKTCESSVYTKVILKTEFGYRHKIFLTISLVSQ